MSVNTTRIYAQKLCRWLCRKTDARDRELTRRNRDEGTIGLLLSLALLICASAHAQKVNVDWDHDITGFGKYKTCSWIKSHKPVPNPLMEQRIVAAIDSQVAAKGLTKVESGGDLKVTL